MGPFLRTVLPLPDGSGSKLPNLKPWVKAVFATYILLAIPVLTFLSFLLITRLPILVEITWDSFLDQTSVFSHA
jgi:hypothetical protein